MDEKGYFSKVCLYRFILARTPFSGKKNVLFFLVWGEHLSLWKFMPCFRSPQSSLPMHRFPPLSLPAPYVPLLLTLRYASPSVSMDPQSWVNSTTCSPTVRCVSWDPWQRPNGSLFQALPPQLGPLSILLFLSTPMGFAVWFHVFLFSTSTWASHQCWHPY